VNVSLIHRTLTLCAVLFLACALCPAPLFAAEKEGVTFNFVEVELTSVAKFVSEVTGKNFIFDEKVRGTVTIIAPTELSPDRAFDLFTSVLRLKGFTLVDAGVNAYKIVPVTEAREYSPGAHHLR
jgi:general secretion pathway protein D